MYKIIFFCVWFLQDHVTQKYPADLSLSAMMSFWGTIQASILAACFVKREFWVLKWEQGLMLFVILYGVIITLSYLTLLTCICICSSTWTDIYLLHGFDYPTHLNCWRFSSFC